MLTIEKFKTINKISINKKIEQKNVSITINQIIIRNIVLIIIISLNHSIQFINIKTNRQTTIDNNRNLVYYSQNYFYKSSTKTRQIREQIKKNTRFIDRFSENIFRDNINSNRENDYNRSRKTYVIDEQNKKFIEKKIEKNFFNDDQNSSKNETFNFEKLNYYNSNYSKQKIKIVYCEFRNCYVYHLSTLRIFFSNNRLHNHLRVDCR